MVKKKYVKSDSLQSIKKQFGSEIDPLEAILFSISDHVSLIDKDFKILWANNRAFNQFGNNIIGKKCFSVFQGRTEPCEPYPCHTLKAFEDNQAHFSERKAPSLNGKDIYFHITANPAIKDAAGNTLAVLEIARDITIQKEQEGALQLSEQRYRKLFENSNDGIIIHDLEGNIIEANLKAADLLGYTLDELKQCIAYKLHPKNMQGLARKAFQQMMLDGHVHFEIDFKKKDGSMFNAEVSSSIYDVDGQQLVQGIVRDITARKNVEAEKQNLIKELSVALDEVKKLSGMLPICSYCKKIRDDKGYWQQLEEYLSEHSEARFSHGICQDCLKKHHSDLL